MISAFAAAPVPGLFESCQVRFMSSEPCLSLSSSEDLDDLLLVPDVFPAKQFDADLWGLADLFSADSGSETGTVLSLTPSASDSDASTRFPELSSSEQSQHTHAPGRGKCLPSRPVAAPVLPPSGLSLKLDYTSVASAWGEISGGRPAMRLGTVDLASFTSALPALHDQNAAQPTESVLPLVSVSSEGSQGASAVPLTEEELQARKAALARYKEKKSARANNPSKKVRYEMRRINAEKRPRIKGRFVKKSELETYMSSQQTCADLNECLVPAY